MKILIVLVSVKISGPNHIFQRKLGKNSTNLKKKKKKGGGGQRVRGLQLIGNKYKPNLLIIQKICFMNSMYFISGFSGYIFT